jgi:hypothetical protein
MFEEPTLPPHLLPLYTVFYIAADDEPSDADSTEIWEVGLEEGYPIAICFSDEDAHTVADALNSSRLAPIADAALVASFKQTNGKSVIACALLGEIRRRHLDV